MLKRLLSLCAVISLLVISPAERPAEARTPTDTGPWRQGWTWTGGTDGKISAGPAREIKTIEGTVYEEEWKVEPMWSGWMRRSTTTFAFAEPYHQYSIMQVASAPHMVYPQSCSPYFGAGSTSLFHCGLQMAYSGSPYSVVGINGTTRFFVLKASGPNTVEMTQMSLESFLASGTYRGINGTGIGGTGRWGCAYAHNSYDSGNIGAIAFNNPTNVGGPLCYGSRLHSVAFDRGVPIFRPADGIGNLDHHSCASRPPYEEKEQTRVSRAGYVFDKQGNVILPESFGITDEKGNVWAEFGTFSFDKTVMVKDQASLADFEYNNRSATFCIGSYCKTGSNVYLYYTTGENTTSPLVISVPPLKLHNYGNTAVTYHYAVGVASREKGGFIVAYTGDRTVAAGVTETVQLQSVTIPAEQLTPGDKLTVRAVVVGDRGDMSKSETFFASITGVCPDHPYCWADGIRVRYIFNVNSFANSRPHIVDGEVNNLGFLPVVHTLFGKMLVKPFRLLSDINLTHIRYVGDVAQATVSLIPVQVSLSGPTDVKLGINIEGADQFWSSGASFPVSTDVPLFPAIQFNPQLVVQYVMTNTNGTVISGTVSPDMYKVRGAVTAYFSDGVWYFGYRTKQGAPRGAPPAIAEREITFAPSQRPYREALATERCYGYPDPDICFWAPACVAFNVSNCYHTPGSPLEVSGTIRVAARATITTTEGTLVLWSPWSSPIPLSWDVYFQQERR
jgi:hypothetical protein